MTNLRLMIPPPLAKQTQSPRYGHQETDLG